MTDADPAGGPATPTLRQEGDVWVLHLGDGENRFRPDWVGAITEHLDRVEARPAPRALVTTAGGKIWSNGLDLDWIGEHPDEAGPFLADVHRLFARFLGSSVPTVAAIGGHAFAAGAMLATAHDDLVMRADRGYFCVPEVDLGLPFTEGMNALLQSRWSKRTAHEAMTTGRRYGGEEALAAGIVQEAVPADEVLTRAFERATRLAGKDPATFRAIKQRLYSHALSVLDPD
ncbi:MAG: enoyl-CoA hydratase/isomerase family protein [Microthrixaceae bacterium]